MKHLTSDMVWLVDQTVTLPDGSTQTVLVPQVYLVVQDGDLKGDGTLMAGRNTNQEKEFHEVKQSGFSINAGSPVMDAFETIDRMSTASSKTDNPIMKALAFVSAGMAANDALNAVTRPPSEGGGGGGTITLDYGASSSSTTTHRSSTTVLGSTVAAGNDLTILSTGAGKDSDITVLGSALSAGRNAVLVAEGDILMKAASNTRHQDTQTKSVDGTVGVGVMIGTDGNGGYGAGFIVKGSVSASRSTEDGDDLTWTNSSVTAGSALGLKSGGDTSLIGASGKADRILASVGGNLLLQSLQDESTYHSKNQSASAGGTYCYGYCSSSVYGSYSQGALNSNFKTVTEQTGLWAGDGGFQINVKDNTTLIGSVIASSDKAVADGLNFLSTGTLVTQDIKNVAKYDGYQVGLSGGYSWGGAQQVNSGGSTTVPSKGGASAFPPTVVAALGSDRSTTESAISGGTIVIRDSDGQLALTGKSVADSIASLNRDTSDTLNSLSPIFDKEKIQAGFDIVTTFQKETGTFLASKAQEYDALKKALDAAPPEGPLHDSLQAQLNDAAQWVQGGTYRMILTAGTAALAGNVTGGVGQAVQAATINVLQSMGAAQIKKYADALGGEGSAGHVALHAILACGGVRWRGGAGR
ncbi:hypothetical protein BOSP111201_04005 [Bordetella sputigena]|uniref:hemagglutinin repeat-containing protein n=1 Tax=Bordetella sputigena TaxID=1416810 RepID=UPI0039EF87B9